MREGGRRWDTAIRGTTASLPKFSSQVLLQAQRNDRTQKRRKGSSVTVAGLAIGDLVRLEGLAAAAA